MKRKNFPLRKDARRKVAIQNLEAALFRRENESEVDNKASISELRNAIYNTKSKLLS